MTTKIAYLRLPADLLDQLDRIIPRTNFSSRSEYFAACAAVTLHHTGPAAEKLDPATTAWINSVVAAAEELRQELFLLIQTIAHSVLAVKGVPAALQHTGDILRQELYRKTGIWATDEELIRELKAYELVHHTEFLYQRSSVRAEQNGIVPGRITHSATDTLS